MIKKKTLFFHSSKQHCLTNAMQECLGLLCSRLNELGLNKRCVVKQTLFIKSISEDEFRKNIVILGDHLDDFYGKLTPSTSYVTQCPQDDVWVTMEVLVICEVDNVSLLSLKKCRETVYSVLNRDGYKELFCAGITGGNTSGVSSEEYFEEAFICLGQLLKDEGMSFSNIVRQWNYIENITGYIEGEGESKQIYQTFNNIRSRHYDLCVFTNGYPAATGIGMKFGGVVIEAVAQSGMNDVKVLPLGSPVQLNAHEYSSDVLEPGLFGGEKTPKFERAILVSSGKEDLHNIYISGTAAISGELSIDSACPLKQTSATLDNIALLISKENIAAHGTTLTSDPQPSSLKIYVKDKKFMRDIERLCRQRFTNTEMLFLQADICREELLVEIEGEVSSPGERENKPGRRLVHP